MESWQYFLLAKHWTLIPSTEPALLAVGDGVQQ